MSSYRGVALALLAVAVVGGCSSSDGGGEPQEAVDGPSLNGTYQFEFDVAKRTELGQPAPRTEPMTSRWAFRSACTDDGCVATATRLKPDGSATDTQVVLDYFDDNWVMVFAEDGRCNQGGQPARIIGTWTLKPQPDDKLTGTWTEITTGNDCPFVQQMPVTVTRQGDTQGDVEVADPASVPPRKPSKADGFHGHYSQTINTRPPSADTATLPVEVVTYCVRNTDECVSTQASTVADAPLLTPLTWADGHGTYRFDRGQQPCPDNPELTAQSFGYDDVVLPESAPNPIPALTGSRHLEFLEPCVGERWYDLSYERGEAPAEPAPAPAEPAPAPAEPAPVEPTPGG